MNCQVLQQPKQPQRCKGYVLPVKPYGYDKLIQRIKSDEGSEYYFGIHIDDLGNGRVGLHIPLSELADFSTRHNTTKVNDYADFVNEYASLDFSYTPREWYETMSKGAIEICAPQWAAILSF